ncbi:hypothetical protein V6N12_009982 [Hibiscus sabdariffa]|uniref:Reverse transcriptase domain-containing protein n=1 Tax=Hibiscus sabdariffa TaxID=183260 RepID=A0ABR2EE37_9ROSI
MEDILSIDDDVIDLLEEDIQFGNVEGIPSIVFSERVQSPTFKNMDLILVFKFISPAQTSFIDDRNISKNIIINHEIVHFMQSKEGKFMWMTVNVDLRKAFDHFPPHSCLKLFVDSLLHEVGPASTLRVQFP